MSVRIVQLRSSLSPEHSILISMQFNAFTVVFESGRNSCHAKIANLPWSVPQIWSIPLPIWSNAAQSPNSRGWTLPAGVLSENTVRVNPEIVEIMCSTFSSADVRPPNVPVSPYVLYELSAYSFSSGDLNSDEIFEIIESEVWKWILLVEKGDKVLSEWSMSRCNSSSKAEKEGSSSHYGRRRVGYFVVMQSWS